MVFCEFIFLTVFDRTQTAQSEEARESECAGKCIEKISRCRLCESVWMCLFPSPPSHISFHQTIFLITQQKRQQPDFKQHHATAREANITLQAGKGHFETWACKDKHPKILPNGCVYSLIFTCLKLFDRCFHLLKCPLDCFANLVSELCHFW